MESWNEDWVVFETLVGSQVYGTATPDSDFDYRGVCVLPMEMTDHLFANFEQKDSWGDQKLPYPPERTKDRVVYNLKKFMKICLDANPSVLELLFVPETFWVKSSAAWRYISENRGVFLSKKVKFTFTGYAHSQLSRIKRHRGWLLNPPKEEPTREGYGLPKNPLLSTEQLSALLTIPEEFVGKNHQEMARKEKAFHEARTHWNMYMEWFKHRNPARAEMEKKFGFDCKHASHLIRLMYEGEEILTKHTITLPRPEAKLLMDIRNGGYSYEKVVEMAEGMDAKFDTLYETSTLPHGPSFVTANEIYFTILANRDMPGWR
jgi:predicted nucleotidyltransferase